HEMKMDAPISEVMATEIITAYPDETLNETLARFGSHDLGHIPVVERDDPGTVVGIVTRTDIIEAYKRAQIVQSAMD
ncbi:MAG: CBS domain-containing protein, partial [bacterium]